MLAVHCREAVELQPLDLARQLAAGVPHGAPGRQEELIARTEGLTKIIVDPDQLSLAIGKKGQNARLTSKLTGWNIDIDKEETAELGFEGKVARAVSQLAAIPGIEKEKAELLVKSGFHSLEGLLAADFADLAEIVGPEKATAVHAAVAAENEKRGATDEPTTPPDGEATSPA